MRRRTPDSLLSIAADTPIFRPHLPCHIAQSPLPLRQFPISITTSPIPLPPRPFSLAYSQISLAHSPISLATSPIFLANSLSLHTLRAPISTLLRRCSQRPVQRPRRVSKEPAARRGRRPRQALFVERPHLCGVRDSRENGRVCKGEWAARRQIGITCAEKSVTPRFGPAVLCGSVGGYVWRRGGGEDRLTRRRRERWGGGEGAVTRCARFWFCVCDGGVRRVFDGAVLGRASVE